MTSVSVEGRRPYPNTAELIGGYIPRVLDIRQRLNGAMGFDRGTYVRQERDYRTALIQLPDDLAARVSMEMINPISYDFDFNVKCVVGPRAVFRGLANDFHLRSPFRNDTFCTAYLSVTADDIVYFLQQPKESSHLSFPGGVKTDGNLIHYRRNQGTYTHLGPYSLAAVAHVVTEMEKVAGYLEQSIQTAGSFRFQERVYTPSQK